jgi:hypothetical protein
MKMKINHKYHWLQDRISYALLYASVNGVILASK